MHIYEKKSLKMTTLQVVFDCGGLYENDGRYGTFHLMEHLICKSFQDLHHELTREGITWNACTGDSHVIFHWTGLDSRLTPERKTELVKRILGGLSCVSKEDFENEKKTVIQEYLDYFNDSSVCKELNLDRKLFGYYSAIGRKRDIENFSYEDMIQVKKEWFSNPANIIEIGPSKTNLDFVEYKSRESESSKIFYSENRKDIEYEDGEEINKCLVTAVCKKSISKKDYPYIEIAIGMLTTGMESPFYEEIRVKRGLSYYSKGGINALIHSAFATFSACTNADRKDELVELYKSLFENIEDYLSEERFNDIISSINLSREKRKILRFASVSDLINTTEYKLPKSLKRIKFEKVVKVAKKYFNNKSVKIFA